VNISDKVTEAGARVLENGHRALLAVTGGRFPRRVLGMQPVELHTVGRVSGQPRNTMLTAPIFTPERVVVVASKGGHSDNPDWYKNLVKTPEVSITADGVTTEMTAHTASPDEKAELWPRIVKAYRGYEGYQQRTDRDIPVVICTPR
jgi:deazaflavin-dependent oxidoreductase (nitroreductase family)